MKPLAVAMVLLALAVRAQAEPPDAAALPTDDELNEFLTDPGTSADDAYRIGARLFEARRYEGAERAWLRAYSLGRDPTLLVAVADTRQRRGDEAGAVAMLEQYLDRRPDAPDRLSIEARIGALLQSPAELVIRSREPGRAILIDGAPVEQKTPARIEVEPGTHTVIVVGEGTRVGEKTVQVAYGEVKELDFAPEAPSELKVQETEEARLEAELVTRREDRTIRRAVISTGTIAAAALVAGAALRIEASASQGDRLATFSNVSFGLAALSAITSFTLFMTHKNKRTRERDLARLRIDARGAGASATLRF
ncbi:MAG TPA: PEGA domain-containing protein [Polyangiales bacterium]|jgi:hypothetical protein|nr:PEGA domain-containing protein [Polyangiales bacterium]